jgi:phospholipase/carboxylesterase
LFVVTSRLAEQQLIMSHPRRSLSLPQRAASPAAFEIESGLFSTSQRDTIHATFAPMHYTPGYAYPLLVWLHGPGCDERQLMRIMPMVSIRNHVGIAPRGTVISPLCQSGDEPPVYGWSHDERGLHEAEQRVFDAIESAFRGFNIHPRRVFLAGFDTGGTLAFRLAMNHPYKFAGVISLGGPLPCGGAPLARLPEARQLSIFLGVGRRGQVYDESHVCENLRLLHTAGMSITLRAYPCGHEISPQMLSDVDAWIIEQITSAKANVDAATV